MSNPEITHKIFSFNVSLMKLGPDPLNEKNVVAYKVLDEDNEPILLGVEYEDEAEKTINNQLEKLGRGLTGSSTAHAIRQENKQDHKLEN